MQYVIAAIKIAVAALILLALVRLVVRKADWIRRRIEQLRAIASLLFACRLPAAAVTVLGLLMIVAEPAQDILIELAEFSGETILRATKIFGSLLVLSGVAWYWSRLTLLHKFVDRPSGAFGQWLEDIIPRAIGGAPFGFAGLALWHAAYAHGKHGDWSPFATYALLGALLILLAFGMARAYGKRRGLMQKLLPEPKGWRQHLVPQKVELDRPFATENPIARGVLWVGAILSLLFMIWAVANSVSIGATFGPIAILVIGTAQIIPIGAFIAVWGKWKGVPALSLVSAWAMLLPLLPALPWLSAVFTDNHDMRTLEPSAKAPIAARPSVVEGLKQWKSAQAAGPSRDLPLVIVATAGGASRAAYFTGLVLAELSDRLPCFPRRVFAISAVSGGSLGAVLYKGLADADVAASSAAECLAHEAKAAARPRPVFRLAIDTFFDGNDFLGAAFAAMVYPDLLQRFVPAFGIGDGFSATLPDRSQALEQSWEAAWATTVPKLVGLKPSKDFFGASFAAQITAPYLLLNGTSVETGRRVTATTLKLGSTYGDDLPGFDLLKDMKRDIRNSTAVTVSARFPIVSPAGGYYVWDDKGQQRQSKIGHVVDGGYFENFGAATAEEVLQIIVRESDPVVRPLMIVISSDPGFDGIQRPKDQGEFHPGCAKANPGDLFCEADPSVWANEVLGPIQGVLNARTARGEQATASLRQLMRDRVTSPTAEERDENFFHFRQCEVPGHVPPTMSWHDSPRARTLMQAMMPTQPSAKDWCGNRATVERFVKRYQALLKQP